MKKLLCIGVLSIASVTACANDAAFNQTLVRLINQLDAMMPLLEEAKQNMATESRLHFHIDAFEGADNQWHPGLRDDLVMIRKALIDYINQPAIAPKTIEPLSLDFIGDK